MKVHRGLSKLAAVEPDAIGRLREHAGVPSSYSDIDLAAWLHSCEGDVLSAAAKWAAAQDSKRDFAGLTIRDVAPFLRAPSPSRRLPDGCMVVLEDMKGGVARDNLGRPVCLSIGMQHGSATEMQRQMMYCMQRIAAHARPGIPAHAACVVIDVVPQEKGAPASFRFPDKDVRTLFDLQNRVLPGAQFSTTHFCGLPRFVTFAFRLVRPFMSRESYEAMVLKPSFSHLSRAIPSECMLPRWGGTLDFDLDEYVEWRASEEGVPLSELPSRGAGRAFDAKRAAAAAAAAFQESMQGGAGGSISAKALIEAEPEAAAPAEGSGDRPAVFHGVVEKRGSGRGLFATKRWKRKLLVLSPGLGLVYFDDVAVSDENRATTIIALNEATSAVERCDADGSGPAHQFRIRAASRDYLFGVASADEVEQWVSAVQAHMVAARAAMAQVGQTPPLADALRES